MPYAELACSNYSIAVKPSLLALPKVVTMRAIDHFREILRQLRRPRDQFSSNAEVHAAAECSTRPSQESSGGGSHERWCTTFGSDGQSTVKEIHPDQAAVEHTVIQ